MPLPAAWSSPGCASSTTGSWSSSTRFAIYGGLIAAIFAGIGIWLGRGAVRERVVTREVTVEVPVEVPSMPAVGARMPFVAGSRPRSPSWSSPARELEVLQLMADGLCNKEMAERLFISENTVKTHCSRLFDKLGAGRRTQAVQMARGLRLIP